MKSGMGPFVSICIPVFNGGPFFERCVESALAQQHGNTEIIIVDNCSSDLTADTARRLQKQDGRVRFFSNHENIGLVKNTNRCVQLAQGEWVKFLHADDELDPECVAALIESVDADDDVVFCSRRFRFAPETSVDWRNWYMNHGELVRSLFGAGPGLCAEEFRRAICRNIGSNLLGEPSNVMVRRSAFDRFGFFDARFRHIDDLEMWTRIGSQSGVRYCPSPMVTYNVHEMSATNKNWTKEEFRLKFLERLVLLDKFASAQDYEALRATARRMSPPVDFAKLAWLALAGARAVIRRAGAGSEYAKECERELCGVLGDLTSTPPRLSNRLSWEIERILNRYLRRISARFNRNG